MLSDVGKTDQTENIDDKIRNDTKTTSIFNRIHTENRLMRFIIYVVITACAFGLGIRYCFKCFMRRRRLQHQDAELQRDEADHVPDVSYQTHFRRLDQQIPETPDVRGSSSSFRSPPSIQELNERQRAQSDPSAGTNATGRYDLRQSVRNKKPGAISSDPVSPSKSSSSRRKKGSQSSTESFHTASDAGSALEVPSSSGTAEKQKTN